MTVAVIDLDKYQRPDFSTIAPKDLKVEWYSGTGAGGQHRNKHQNSVRLTHLPTGWTETAQCRSREASYREALARMQQVLHAKSSHQQLKAQSVERKEQMGSGMRGDKIRTYRFQDDVASDHRSGNKANLSKVLSGNFNLLW